MRSLYDKIWDRLKSDRVQLKEDIDQEATPILVFGQFNSARIVTVGMNPSEREFRDKPSGTIYGSPLTGDQQRFLHWPRDGELTSDLRELAFERMTKYFTRGRAYTHWFDKYSPLLRSLSADYGSGTACHTDVISPFATARGVGSCERSKVSCLKKFGGPLWLGVMEKIPHAELIFGCGSVQHSIKGLLGIPAWQKHSTPLDKKGGKTNIKRPFLVSAEAKLPVSGRSIIVFCWKPNVNGSPLCWLSEKESEELGHVVREIATGKGFLQLGR